MILSLHDTGIRWYHIVIVWYWNPLVVDGMWKRLDCVMLVWCLLQFVAATIIVWLLLLCDMTRVHYSMQWPMLPRDFHILYHIAYIIITPYSFVGQRRTGALTEPAFSQDFSPFLFCHHQVSFRAAVWYHSTVYFCDWFIWWPCDNGSW